MFFYRNMLGIYYSSDFEMYIFAHQILLDLLMQMHGLSWLHLQQLKAQEDCYDSLIVQFTEDHVQVS